MSWVACCGAGVGAVARAAGAGTAARLSGATSTRGGRILDLTRPVFVRVVHGYVDVARGIDGSRGLRLHCILLILSVMI